MALTLLFVESFANGGSASVEEECVMSNYVLPLALGACLSVVYINLGTAQAQKQQSETEKPSEEKISTEKKGNESSEAIQINSLQPVTITANRRKKKLLDTPGNVSTVTREELDRRMDNVTEDVFRYEPGIEVPRQTTGTDPFSSSGGISIRGVGGNRTQVLVDGNRTIERITDSTRDIVDSSNVKAVEIVRGPASVLWGSDALGGTVNFVTKDPSDYLKDGKDIGGSASFNYGSVDNAYTESVTGAARISPRLEAMIAFTRRDANEIELNNARTGAGAVQNCTRNPEATQCDEFDPLNSRSNNLLGKLVWSPSDTNQFKLTGEYFTRNTDVEQNSVLGDQLNFMGTVTARIQSYNHSQEIQRWRASLEQDWSPEVDWLDRLKWQLTYSPQEVNRSNNRLRELVPSGDIERRLIDQQYEEAFYEGDIQFDSSFDLGSTTHALTYGFDGDMTTTDYNREDITTNITAGTTTVSRAGGFNFADATTIRADAYLQDEIGFFGGRLKIVPGARLSYYSIDPKTDSDYQLVPGAEPRKITETDLQFKLGTIFEITDTYSVYGQYSQGFKMPTAQQLFQSLDSLPFFALVPNPDLKPESVDSFEVGFRGDYGSRGYFSVNVFMARYKDFIQNFVDADPTDFGLAPGTNVLTYDNVDRLSLYGIEASAAFQITPSWSTRIGVSYQDGETRDGGVTETYNGALPFQAVTGVRYSDRDLGFDVELVGTFQAGANDVADRSTDFKPSGYAVFDLIAGWEVLPNMMLRGGLYNIFDTRYFPAETRGFSINGSDAVKRTNPIELQTAPGRTFKVGMSYTF